MKTLFSFLLLLLFSSTAQSQAYTPFIVNNAKWVNNWYEALCQNGGGSFDIKGDTVYTTVSDTVIGGFKYKSLVASVYHFVLDCNQHVTASFYDYTAPTGFLRQDTVGRKIFFLATDSQTETTLYNFNIHIGDTVFSSTQLLDTVISIDSFQSNGKYYKRFKIYDNLYWIEGFGSTGGLFNRFYYNPFGSPWLGCFGFNGLTIYPQYDTVSCTSLTLSASVINEIPSSLSPNPTTNTCTMQWNTPGTFSATLFDITGREIIPLFTQQNISSFNINTTPLPPGLYFIKLTDNNGQFAVSKLQKE